MWRLEATLKTGRHRKARRVGKLIPIVMNYRNLCKLSIGLIIAIVFFACINSSGLSGTYTDGKRVQTVDNLGKTRWRWIDGNYKVTFMEGHTLSVELAKNGYGTLSGTYTIEGKMIRADFGLIKLNYQIIDKTTLNTNVNDESYTLKKQ